MKEKIVIKGYTVSLHFDKEDSIWIAESGYPLGFRTHGETKYKAIEEMGRVIEDHI